MEKGKNDMCWLYVGPKESVMFKREQMLPMYNPHET